MTRVSILDIAHRDQRGGVKLNLLRGPPETEEGGSPLRPLPPDSREDALVRMLAVILFVALVAAIFWV